MIKYKVYLASTFNPDTRDNMYSAINILRNTNVLDVYAPVEHEIINAWDYPNSEWGLMVFENDITAIQQSDIVVVLSYGRIEDTSGVTWEAGFAFALGKKVIIVEMTDNIMSLMVANGRYATVRGLDGLANYDWNLMLQMRTNTEQK